MSQSKKFFAAALAVSALLGGVSVQALDLPNLKKQPVLQWVDAEGDQKGHTVIHTGIDNGKGYYTNDGIIQLQASSVQIGVGDESASFNAADVKNFSTFYQNFKDIKAEDLKNNADLLVKYKEAGIVPGTVDKGTDGAVYGIAIGNYSHSASNGVAMGNKANAATNGSVAIGGLSEAGNGSNNQATAIGYNAQALKASSVALGANSVANEANTVSVGKAGGERRIVNVAAGTKDTDAVNYKQLSDVGAKADGLKETIGSADFSGTAYAKGAADVTDAIYHVDTQVKTNTENIQTNTDMIGTADFTKTHYAAKTQNMTDALYAVDGQVKANADKLVTVETEAKKHTTLTEKTGNLNVVKTDKDGQANYDVSLSNHVTLSKDNNKVDLNGDEGTISVKNNSGIGTVDFTSATMDFNKDGLTISQNYGVESAMLNANSTNIKGGTITAKGTLDKGISIDMPGFIPDINVQNYDRTEVKGGTIVSTIGNDYTGAKHTFEVNDNGVTFTHQDSNLIKDDVISKTAIDGSHITAGTVKINGESGSTMTGLTNTNWDANGTYNAGRAATEEQLKGAYDDVSSKITETAATAKKHTTVKNGDNIELTEGTNEDGGKEYTVSLAKDITVDSVTAETAKLGGVSFDGKGAFSTTVERSMLGGTNTLSFNDLGLTISGTKDDGSAYGSTNILGGTITTNKVTGLADGEISATSKDAVNGSQLNAVATEAGKKTTVSAGDENVTVEKDGELGYKVGLADNISVKDIQADTAKLGGVEFAGNGVFSTTVNRSMLGGTNTLSFNDLGLTISGTKDDGSAYGSTNILGGTITTNKVTGLADGEISATSTDAVNGSQLNEVKSQVSTLDKDAVKYDSNGELHAGKENTGKLDLKDDGSASISSSKGNGFTANADGTNTIGGNTTIKGTLEVKGDFSVNGQKVVTAEDINKVSGTLNELDAYAGKKDDLKVTGANGDKVNNLTDAVNANFDKINANTQSIDNINANIGATGKDGKVNLTNGADTIEKGINQNTVDIRNNQNAINSLGRSVNKLGGEIDSVGAISAALAGLHPIDYDPTQSKYQLSAALGSYDGSSALALGGFYNFNKDVLLSLGVSTALKGERKTAGNLGVTFRIGAGAEKKEVPEADKDILTRIAELAQKVSVLEQKNDKLEQENADQKKQIEVLQAKTF